MNTSRALAALLASVATLPAFAQTTYDWSGATSGNIGTAAAWGGTTPTSADIARWNAATYTNAPTVNANITFGQLLFDAGNTNGVTFGSGATTLTLNGVSGVGIQMNSGSGAVSTGSAKFALGAAQSWTNNSASLLTVGGTIANGGFNLTLDGSGNTTLGGIISGTGGIVKSGAGNLTLSGANTFTTGGVSLSAGTLTLGNNAALGASASSVLTITGGTIDVTAARTTNNAQNWNGDFTFAGSNTWSTGTGAITLNATRQVTVSASTMTVAGVIGDGTSGYGLIKAGAGTLTLSGANTFSGVTTLNAGVLNTTTLAAVNTASGIGKGSVSGSAADLVFGGGTLQYNTAAVATTNRLFTIGNANGLTATLDSSAASSTNTMSFTGTGALAFGGSGARTLTLTGSNTGTNTLSSIIGDGTGGATSLVKSGAGMWVLSGTNTYTGATTLSNGTLSAGVTENLGAAAANIVFDGGTLRITGTTLTTVSGIGHTVVVNSGKAVSLDINNLANTFTYDQVLGGTGGLTKLGQGTLVLNQANTYSGATTIIGTGSGTYPQAGVLKFNASNNLGDGSATNGIVMSGNGVLELTGGTVDLGINRTITMAGTGIIQVDTGTALTLSGNITSTANATLSVYTAPSGSSSVLISGNITDGGSSVTSFNTGFGSGGYGLGTIELTGANSYSGQTFVDFIGQAGTLTTSGSNSSTGTTLVQGGTLNLNSVTNGGIASGQLELRTGYLKASMAVSLSNAVLNTNNFNITGAQNITFTGDFTAGAATGRGLINNMTAGVLTLDGAKFNLGDSTTDGNTYLQDGAGNTVINSIIQDYSGGVGTAAGNLSKAGTGTLTLSGANTYTGVTTLTAGIVSVNTIGNGGAASSIGQSSNAATNLVFNGGTLTYTGANATSDRAFTINASKTATINTTNNLTLAGATGTATNGALTKTGAGKLTLTGANTYTGATSIATNGGTLQFAQQTSLYNNNTVNWTAANIRVASGGTLAFNVGGTGEFTTGDVTTLLTNLAASTNATTNGMAAGSNLGFDTTNAGGSFTISNVLANTTGAAGGARGLTKLGVGTLVLGNTNTYTGTTSVNAGTLALGIANAISASSPVTLNGGTLSTGGFNQTLGTLTLAATSIIDLDAGASALVFADSSGVTWGSSIGLSFINFTVGVDSIRIGTTSGGLTGAQLAQITINGGAATIDSSGFLVSSIPEPSTFALLAGAAGLLLVTGRRVRNRRTS